MRSRACIAIIIVLCILMGGTASNARTWCVKADGSGDVPDIKTGVYFYKLETPKFTQTRKMVITK